MYRYLIFRFVSVGENYLSYILSAYNILIYPIISLVIIYLVDCFNNNRPVTDLARILQDARRCYFRIALIYLALGLLRIYFSFVTSVIIFFIMYLKFPFLEQEIFFKNSPLGLAIKNSYELANRKDIEKAIAIVSVILFIGFLVIRKLRLYILGTAIGHSQLILIAISVFELATFFFSKAVITKVYTRLS